MRDESNIGEDNESITENGGGETKTDEEETYEEERKLNDE
jgi:hypothetical protein